MINLQKDIVQPLGEHNKPTACVKTSSLKDNGYILEYPFEYFNPPQSAICETLGKYNNLVVTSPTASGKTIMSEIRIAETLGDGYKSLVLTPLKALTEERIMDWTDVNHTFVYKKVVPITGDYALTPKKREELKEADIIVATSEMLDSKTRNYENNEWLHDVRLLVVDEAHLIGSASRGPRLESAVMRFSKLNPECRIVLMSATVPNNKDLVDWLENLTHHSTELITSNYRPCILNKTFVSFDDTFVSGRDKYNKVEQLRMEACYKLFMQNKNDQHIVFTGPKSWGYQFKEYLKQYGINAEFHNADLGKDKRSKIENDFRTGKIHVLISTSTLSWGCYRFGTQINMFDGISKSIEDIKVNDKVMSFDGIKFVPNKVLKVGTKKVENSFRVELESGEICDVSPDHMFYGAIKRNIPDWVSVKDLKVGDFLAVPSGFNLYDNNNNKDNKLNHRGYILGFAAGDGCLVDCGEHADGSKKMLLDISGGIEDLEYLENLRYVMCDEFEYDIPGINFDTYGNPHITCKAKTVSESFKDVLPLSDSKENMIIPVEIVSDSNLLLSFLSGLFDADASVDLHGGCGISIELTSISEKLIRQIQQILLNYNIRSNVSKKKMKDRVINGRFQPAVREYIWRLRIYGKQVWEFQTKIGFCLNRKKSIIYNFDFPNEEEDYNRKDLIPVRNLLYDTVLEKGFTCAEFNKLTGIDKWKIEKDSEITRNKLKEAVKYLIKLDFSHPLYQLCNSNLLWKKIISIKEVEGGDFQDIEVENAHSYVGAGIVSHNCNLPARRVILAHTTYGLEPMEICDIEQSCGRSGRPKYDKVGDAYILIPKSQYDAEVQRIKAGFKVKSNIYTIDNLAFHAVSEISMGNIRTVHDFFEWYKDTLAYVQNVNIEERDCLKVFKLLEEKKMIRNMSDPGEEPRYETTRLGDITSSMYMSPLDVYDWFFNFLQVPRLNVSLDSTVRQTQEINKQIALALATCYEYRKNRPFCSRAEANCLTATRFAKVSPGDFNGVKKIAACYYALLNGDPISSQLTSTAEGLKIDLKRLLATTKQIHHKYAGFIAKNNPDDIKGYHYPVHEWDKLYYRIIYGVPEEKIELVSIPGIGKKYCDRLYDNGIQTRKQFLENEERVRTVLGDKIYQKVMNGLAEEKNA